MKRIYPELAAVDLRRLSKLTTVPHNAIALEIAADAAEDGLTDAAALTLDGLGSFGAAVRGLVIDGIDVERAEAIRLALGL